MTAAKPNTIFVVVESNVHGRRQFDLVETRKYVRKNGDRSEVAVWSTPCAICGDPFEVTSPCSVTALINRSDFETVTCPGHRITRSEAAGIGNAKDKKAAFEKVAATKLATPDWP